MQVKIRPLQETDALVSWRWRNDPEVWRLTGSRPDREITPEIELDWIRKVLRDEKTRRFAILVEDAGAGPVYVGNIQLTNIHDGSAEEHIFIGNREYWGRGVAQAATRELLKHAFGELKLNRIVARVRAENTSMIRADEKVGFRAIGHETRKTAGGEPTMWVVLEATPCSCSESYSVSVS